MLNNVETYLVNNKPTVQYIVIKSVLVWGVGMEGIRLKALANMRKNMGFMIIFPVLRSTNSGLCD